MQDTFATPVILEAHVHAALVAEARKAASHECCGLLLGSIAHRIGEIVPSPNIAQDPARHFEIDPVILIAAEKEARAGGRRLIGYYHSHPVGEAVPSATDARLSAADGRIWAIIADRDVRLWQNVSGGAVHDMFDEIKLQVAR